MPNQIREMTSEELLMVVNRVNLKRFNLSDILKLLVSVKFSDDRHCWLRGNDNSQYTSLRVEDVIIRAHRFSYSVFNGSLIPGLEICHHCDIKSCVNPGHLFQGTHNENMQDARNKGRLVEIRIQGNPLYKERDLRIQEELKGNKYTRAEIINNNNNNNNNKELHNKSTLSLEQELKLENFRKQHPRYSRVKAI